VAGYRVLACGAIALLCLGIGDVSPPAAFAQAGQAVVVVDLDGAINRVSERFLEHAIDEANDAGAALLIIELDTPGGLLDSTREMVGAILESDVPIVVYVAPEGAQAASAGTFISAAAALLAMAPGTNIGAAAVVTGTGEDLPETLNRKATEDASAFIRSIAQARDRPAAPLVATILEAKAYSADEALELGIADLVVQSRQALLTELDGRLLATATGDVLVRVADAPVTEVGMTFFERFLGFIADPNVAFLLIALGGLAIVVELFSPGLWFPGVFGVGALIIGWAGIGLLPFSWAGVALLALGLALLAAEAAVQGFGFFGAAGTVALILGGLFVVGFFGSPGLPGASFAVNRWILVGVGAAVGLGVVWLARAARQSQTGPGYVSVTAHAALVGSVAEVTSRLAPEGEVFVASERWTARLTQGGVAEVGEFVRVAGLHEICLLVEPIAGRGRTDGPAEELDETTEEGAR
jgi:membrane-bound serine protease (ClpP class)